MGGRGSLFGYARPEDGVYIGYRLEGDGPIDIVHQPEWPGNIDLEREDPWWAAWLAELGTFGRLISHDHRGVGLSSRNIPLPALETRVSDLFRVLEAAGASNPVMIGYLSSGAVNVLAAAMRPTLARAIVWIDPSARYAWAEDYPWGHRAEELEVELDQLSGWGTPSYARSFYGSDRSGNVVDEAKVDALALLSRNACTPDVARELTKMWWETDVRGVLGSVGTPTLLLIPGGSDDALARGEHIAALMPRADLRVMPPHPDLIEDQRPWLDEIRRFIGAERPTVGVNSVLATVLFTDIVGSTEHQAGIGDGAWKDLLGRHNAISRDSFRRWLGTERETTGDGFYATFEGPARAIRCAREIADQVRPLGIEIRAGVHTGECEAFEDRITGLAVSIGARVAAKARASEVLVSQTVKDLVAGSGLGFEDAGEHELKGVPDRWRLYRVVG
jgi:class 3 adenylate cyclase